jgi:hypothetical protein
MILNRRYFDAATGDEVRSRRGGLISGPSGLLLGVAIGNIGNIGFHLVASHRLPSGEYGALVGLLGILLVYSVPASALQVSLTAEASRHHQAGRTVRTGVLQRRFLNVGVGLAMAVAATSSWIASLLHFSSPWAVVWLAAWLAAATAGLVPRAMLLAEEAFAKVALTVIVSTGVKLAGGFLLINGAGVERAMAAVFAGEFVLVILLTLLVGRSEPEAWDLRLPRSESSLSIVAFTGLWLLVAADTALSRYFLDDLEADAYASAATITRVMLFVPQALAVSFFPRMVRSDDETARRLANRLALGIGFAGMVVAAAMAISAEMVMPVLFGLETAPSRQLVAVLALASTAIGTINVFVHYHLPRGRPHSLAGWVGLAIFAVLTLSLNDTPEAIAWALFIGVVAALLVGRPSSPDSPEIAVSDPGHGLADDLELSVILPFSGPRAEEAKDRLVDFLAFGGRLGRSFEVVMVELDEQPVDNPVRSLHWSNVRQIPAGPHGRYRALFSCRGRVVVLCDEDAADPVGCAAWMLRSLHSFDVDAVVGTRRSVMATPWPRSLSVSDLHLTFRRMVVHPQLPDDRSTVKVFRRQALHQALTNVRPTSTSPDFELMAALRLQNALVAEVPVPLLRPSRPTTVTSTLTAIADDMIVSIRARVLSFAVRQSRRRVAAPTPVTVVT